MRGRTNAVRNECSDRRIGPGDTTERDRNYLLKNNLEFSRTLADWAPERPLAEGDRVELSTCAMLLALLAAEPALPLAGSGAPAREAGR